MRAEASRTQLGLPIPSETDKGNHRVGNRRGTGLLRRGPRKGANRPGPVSVGPMRDDAIVRESGDMASFYTVVQYVPDPVADERINAGVIVFSRDRVAARFVKNW